MIFKYPLIFITEQDNWLASVVHTVAILKIEMIKYNMCHSWNSTQCCYNQDSHESSSLFVVFVVHLSLFPLRALKNVSSIRSYDILKRAMDYDAIAFTCSCINISICDYVYQIPLYLIAYCLKQRHSSTTSFIWNSN